MEQQESKIVVVTPGAQDVLNNMMMESGMSSVTGEETTNEESTTLTTTDAVIEPVQVLGQEIIIPDPVVTINVTARLRVIGTVKGHQMTNPEVVHMNFTEPLKTFDGSTWDVKNNILTALADSKLRTHFVDVFLKRIRSDGKVRRQIGGTRWSVDIIDLSRSVENDALGLEKPKFKPKKSSNVIRRRCNGRLFTGCKVDIPDGGVGGSGFCKKCHFDGIEAVYDKYRKLRDKGKTSEEAGAEVGLIKADTNAETPVVTS